ncbi:MAG: hypothetical protein HN521_07795 [Candidatus Latescibacteria bacterium]|jgi:hypothetical protein|nr:hypothetical protein [Candidatus Latescibacterota bacterium]MBT5829792.1 hypothetical protein [Candidatus Latescibacterota bacterium]
MANAKWQTGNDLLRASLLMLAFLLTVGSAHAGEPFAVLELFTSQG